MKKNGFLLIILLLMASAPLSAQVNCYSSTRNQGISLMQKGHYSQAIQLFQSAQSCPDKPENNDLQAKISECKKKVREQAEARQKQKEAQNAEDAVKEEGKKRIEDPVETRQKQIVDTRLREVLCSNSPWYDSPILLAGYPVDGYMLAFSNDGTFVLTTYSDDKETERKGRFSAVERNVVSLEFSNGKKERAKLNQNDLTLSFRNSCYYCQEAMNSFDIMAVSDVWYSMDWEDKPILCFLCRDSNNKPIGFEIRQYQGVSFNGALDELYEMRTKTASKVILLYSKGRKYLCDEEGTIRAEIAHSDVSGSFTLKGRGDLWYLGRFGDQ